MHSILGTLFFRDVTLAFRKGGQALHVAAFFAVVSVLFVLALGSEPQRLQEAGGAIIWVSALLALTLGFPTFFQPDYDDGSMEQLLLQPVAFEWVVATKYLAGWVVYSLPLIVVSPVLGVMLQLPQEALISLILSLAVGTPGIIAIGGLGAALVLGNRGAGVLLSLLIMPLYIPLLIFGSSTSGNADPAAAAFAFKMLLACSAGVVPLSCLAAALIIKAAMR